MWLTKAPRMRRTALALVLAATLAGCGGSTPTIPVGSLNKLVLRQPDLGAPFQQFSGGKQGTSTTTHPATIRRGTAAREAGSPASTDPAPPGLVESRADLFERVAFVLTTKGRLGAALRSFSRPLVVLRCYGSAH